MVLIKIMDFVMPITLFILQKIAEKMFPDQEKEYGYISLGMLIVSSIYSFVNIFMDEVIFSIMFWVQNYWWIVGIYILLIAVLPSIIAQKERRKGTFKAHKDYAVKNCKYNVIGFAASSATFGLIYSVVGNFSYLKFFT